MGSIQQRINQQDLRALIPNLRFKWEWGVIRAQCCILIQYLGAQEPIDNRRIVKGHGFVVTASSGVILFQTFCIPPNEHVKYNSERMTLVTVIYTVNKTCRC